MVDQNSSQTTKAQNKDLVQRQPKKLIASTVKDIISKGKTMTGKKPDQIDMNPVREDAELFNNIAKVYDKFHEDMRSDTYKREWGTDSLTKIYKSDTPGQESTDKEFDKKFGKYREATPRSNQERKDIDLVPRDDADRKESDKPYRQQSIQKKKVDEAYGKSYKSPWDKITKALPKMADANKRSEEHIDALKKANKDYQTILDKEAANKKKTNESVNTAGAGSVRGLGTVTGNPDGVSSSYVNANIADADTKDNLLKTHVKAHVDLHAVSDEKSKKGMKEAVWDEPNPKKTHKALTLNQKARAKARAKAAGRPYPNLVDNMAVAKEDINSNFEQKMVNEISPELVGKVNKLRYIEKRPSKTKVASQTLSNAVRKAWLKSKVGVAKNEDV